MRHASLFSGIGGFDLAAEWMGWQNIFWCENDSFCRQILKYHFPNSIAYGDIKTTDFRFHAGQIDILTGGFPCQPFSDAGLRGGTNDPRYLWPEMYRAIREIRPRWVVAENVRGLLSWNGEGLVFNTVCTDLENEGYEVWPFLLPACGVDAPHQRYRIWFIAYRADARTEGMQPRRKNGIYETGTAPNADNSGNTSLRGGDYGNKEKESLEWKFSQPEFSGSCDTWFTPDTASDRLQAGNQIRTSAVGREVVGFDKFPTQSPILSRDDGLSSRLDGITFPRWRQQSIKGYGNAIVPQLGVQLFKTIEAFEKGRS
jgi:DNA (cytosine-5)-methyltransferase 1